METVDPYECIRRVCRLSVAAGAQLETTGFIVIPGPDIPGGMDRLRTAYDSAVASADAADVRVSSSIRVTDFVNRSADFDALYVHAPLLAACCQVVGRPFKLSNTCARTLEPGAPAQELHVDVKYGAPDWPMLGYIWMIDDFDETNGATRFVPGSHRHPADPRERGGQGSGQARMPESLACGPAGSLIVFDASIWHGHSANRSPRPRRSVQGHFVAHDATSALDYHSRMKPDTLARIGDRARYVLGLT
jgi:ectoine hydroxylase-related dioxygenase (phytanoyl-CoA dioxygenase family)